MISTRFCLCYWGWSSFLQVPAGIVWMRYWNLKNNMLNVFMKMKGAFPTIVFLIISSAFLGGGCSKSSNPEPAKLFQLSTQKIAGFNDGRRIRSVSRTPAAEFSFTTPVDRASIPGSFTLRNATGGDIPFN